MKDEELISHLQNFGINQDEAKVYVGLIRMGQSKVRQIFDFTKIDRVKGYRILENVEEIKPCFFRFSSILYPFTRSIFVKSHICLTLL